MEHDLIKGVVFTRVCGQNLLIATRPAWDKCPYTRTLSALQGAFWQGLSQGLSEDEIVSELSQKTKIRNDVLRNRLDDFIHLLEKEGYLREEETGS